MDNIINNEFPGYTSPFGEGSIFNDEGYVNHVNFEKLIPDIKMYHGTMIPYDYRIYESKVTVPAGDPFPGNFFPPHTESKDEGDTMVDQVLDELGSVLIPPGIPSDIEYKQGKDLLFFDGVLNKKRGYIKIDRNHIGFVFELDPGKGIIKFRDHIYYTDPVTQKRKNQWAIQIETMNFETYRALCKAEGLYLSASSLDNIQRRYIDALNKAKDKPGTMAWLYNWMPNYVLLKRAKKDLIDDLATILQGKVKEVGAGYVNEEKIVLNILKLFVAGTTDEKNELLQQLTTRYIKKQALFEVLYDKMNNLFGDDNWTIAINLLYKIWIVSKFSNDTDHSYSGQPETLAYQSKKILGFYQSGYRFSFSKNQIEVEKDYEEWYGERKVVSKKHFTNYGILQSIQLQEIDENGEFIIQKGEMPIPDKIPAFYLKAFDDRNSWQNFEKAAWIALDVVLTFTAVGNLLKLRYLTYLSKGVYYLRVTSGVIQLTTSVIDLLLNFVDCEGKFCKKLRQYLFWVNIATLGIDAVTEQMLRKSAKEALDNIEDLPEGLKKEKEQIREHLEEVVEAGRKTEKIGDSTKSFFQNAGIAIKKEKAFGKVFGQTTEYTCAATSLGMVLEDFAILRSEQSLASALKTAKNGANILNIPKALEEINVFGFKFITRGGKKDITVKFTTLEGALKSGDKKAIASVWSEEFGAHAVIVDKIKNGRVFLRDPLPLYQGSSYSVSVADFANVFNDKFITLKK